MSTSKTHAIIFIHGLGDSGNGWTFLQRQLSSLSRTVHYEFPTAPVDRVTCNGGARCTSWFDIIKIPVLMSEPDNPSSLTENCAKIHKLIDDVAAKHSIPTSNIALGGFSQGGAMSLCAGGSYPLPLAGVACLSGWLLRKDETVANWVTKKDVPVFIAHGSEDVVVVTELGVEAAKRIMEGRGKNTDNVTFHCYEGEGHGACEDELEHLEQFFKSCFKM